MLTVYYHRSRTHLSLQKDAPTPRAVQPPFVGDVIEIPQVMAFTTGTSAEQRSLESCLDRSINTARLTVFVSGEKTRSETRALHKIASSDR